MFLAAVKSLRESDDAHIDLDIYAKGQLINAYEIERTSTHLMSIASSLVNPFDRIGFRVDDPGDEPVDDA